MLTEYENFHISGKLALEYTMHDHEAINQLKIDYEIKHKLLEDTAKQIISIVDKFKLELKVTSAQRELSFSEDYQPNPSVPTPKRLTQYVIFKRKIRYKLNKLLHKIPNNQ